MECRRCGSGLERPGDYCLVCHTANADAVILDIEANQVTVTAILDETPIGERVITTRPEPDPEREHIPIRTLAGLVADEIHRKRPEAVYATGQRDVLGAIRSHSAYEFFRVDGDDPVGTVLSGDDRAALTVIDHAPEEKLGGKHSTVIGGRRGRRALLTVAAHPHVKKIVPGPIDASGVGSRSGLRAKVTRADENGNLRMIVRDGSSVQENRIVTTAANRRDGERIRIDLNEALSDDGFR